MHPVHDVDVLLLLATALSSKRRPAELLEIVAAADLVNQSIPDAPKLVESFARLAQHGLLREEGGGYVLTPAAQEIVSGLPRKAETPERLFVIKDKLSVYHAKGEPAAIAVTVEQLTAAIQAHRAAAKAAVKNLLVPKPQPEAQAKRPGQRQRRPLPARKRQG